MYNARIWLVVPPKVGLPLLLGTVLLLSLIVHTAVLTNTDWYPAFFQGSNAAAGETAAEVASSEALKPRESVV